MSEYLLGFERVSLDCTDLEAVHEFLMTNDLIKGNDELEMIVRQHWPELLHKLVPPVEKMH